MTLAGALDFAAGLRDLGPPRARRAAVAAVLAHTRLEDLAPCRLGTLSKGARQRVGLALALVGDPPALLLDEPTAGLDPEQSAETRRTIRELAPGRAILVSSHALSEVEAMCDRVVILHRGRVLCADSPARLAARLRPASRVDVEAAAPADALTAALAAVPGVRRVDLLSRANGHVRCRVEIEPGRDPRPALAARVTASGWGLLALAPVETSLEEAFLALVGAER
jgi:ABC-2 type transport system ATP-binding protein